MIVPERAMSAGTMLACSAKSILMGSHSFLGPIDPQFDGIPAYNIKTEFEKAEKDLSKNEATFPFWQLQLAKYPAAFYYRVIDAIKLSSHLTSEWLNQYMFNDLSEAERKRKVKKIVSKLNANNMSHARPFSIDFCNEIELNIEVLEQDSLLQEYVLSVHNVFLVAFDLSDCSKIIQNHLGVRYISHQPPPTMLMPQSIIPVPQIRRI